MSLSASKEPLTYSAEQNPLCSKAVHRLKRHAAPLQSQRAPAEPLTTLLTWTPLTTSCQSRLTTKGKSWCPILGETTFIIPIGQNYFKVMKA